MPRFPGQNFSGGELVVDVGFDLVCDRDHGEFAQGQGRRQLINRWEAGMPVGRWVELGAELIGRQGIGRGGEATLLVGEDPEVGFVIQAAGARQEPGRPGKAFPDRDIGCQHMGQGDEAGAGKGFVPDAPQPV